MPRLDKAIQIQDMLQQLERESKVPVQHPKNYLVFNKKTGMWYVGDTYLTHSANILEAKLLSMEEVMNKFKTNEDYEVFPLEKYKEGIERLYHTLNPHEFLPSAAETKK